MTGANLPELIYQFAALISEPKLTVLMLDRLGAGVLVVRRKSAATA